MSEMPENIRVLIERIKKSEFNWKSLHALAWQRARELEKYRGTPQWENNYIEIRLKATKKPPVKYTIKDCYESFISRDDEFTKMQLVAILTFFEALLIETRKLLYTEIKKEMDITETIKFLKGESPYDFFRNKNLLTTTEEKELRLAKASRNQYIHNGNKPNENWFSLYGDVRGKRPAYTEGHPLPVIMHDVEDWTDLIVRITERLESTIKE